MPVKTDFQASPRFLHALWWSKPTPNFYRPSSRFEVVKTSSFYKLLTALRWSKLSIRDSTSILQALPLTIRTFRTSTSFLHAWREVTYHCGGQYGHYKIQQGCGMLCNGENRLVQPSITHCWGHNWQSKALQTSYTFCGSQNELFKLLPCFALVKSDSPKFHKHSRRFEVCENGLFEHIATVRTDSKHLQAFYKP